MNDKTMTKVEELRERVLGNYPKIATNARGLPRLIDIVESVDSLIAAAHAYLWWKKEVAG